MLLSHDELKKLVADGVITNVTDDMISVATIDLTVGEQFYEEHPFGSTVSLRDRQGPVLIPFTASEHQPMILQPGQFCLAATQQQFHLPLDISAEYVLKSSMARSGLNHLLAGFADAGWHNSVLTLELHNVLQHHAIEIRPGDFIGQMKFYRHTPVALEDSYAKRGRYNNDLTVTGMKL